MSWMKAADAISGQEGRAYATIKGRAEEMFYVKSIEVTAKKIKRKFVHWENVATSTKRMDGQTRGK